MTIPPIFGVTGPNIRSNTTRTTSSGFEVPGEVRATAASVPLVSVGLDPFLPFQEVESAPERDRRAKRHAQSLLDDLTKLQHALLGGRVDPDLLERIMVHVRNMPEAADPSLKAAVDAIVLRAHVELARQQIARDEASNEG